MPILSSIASCSASRLAHRGVSLVEILVAMVVLSFGLLGVAALQGRGLQSAHDAYLYSQASALAYDMAERIRVNSAQLALGNYTSSLAHVPGVQNCNGNNCTAANMAAYDLYEWKELAVKTRLPQATASISTAAGPPRTATILLRWRGRGDGTCDSNGNAGTGFYCLSLTIEP